MTDWNVSYEVLVQPFIMRHWASAGCFSPFFNLDLWRKKKKKREIQINDKALRIMPFVCKTRYNPQNSKTQKNASKCIRDDKPYIAWAIYATVDHIPVPVSHRSLT